eukprot:1156988-Pelagomonas_calceolata.AAC.10
MALHHHHRRHHHHHHHHHNMTKEQLMPLNSGYKVTSFANVCIYEFCELKASTKRVHAGPESVNPPHMGVSSQDHACKGSRRTNLIAAASRALNNMVLPLVAVEISISTLMGLKVESLGDEKATLAYTLAHQGGCIAG